MSESSPPITDSARKALALALRRLAERGQVNVGETLGRSESWISRWKADDAENAVRVIDALGLKLVDSDARCYAPEYIEHLRYFAQHGMAQHAPPELEWGGDE